MLTSKLSDEQIIAMYDEICMKQSNEFLYGYHSANKIAHTQNCAMLKALHKIGKYMGEDLRNASWMHSVHFKNLRKIDVVDAQRHLPTKWTGDIANHVFICGSSDLNSFYQIDMEVTEGLFSLHIESNIVETVTLRYGFIDFGYKAFEDLPIELHHGVKYETCSGELLMRFAANSACDIVFRSGRGEQVIIHAYSV